MSVQVGLGWNPNSPADNVTSYSVNRGTLSGVYTDQTNVGNVTSAFDTVAATGTYFWAVTAQNAQGISPPSNEVSEFVFVPPTLRFAPTRMVVG